MPHMQQSHMVHGQFGKVNNYTIIDFKDYPLYLDVNARQRLLDNVMSCNTEYLFLISSRQRFIQGADTREFHLPDTYPDMRDVLAEFDKSPSTIITILTGNAQGLGFEIELASDYRAATMSITCSLPEVKMGLIPGSGGTVRLPRLTSEHFANYMIESGDACNAISLYNNNVIDYLFASNMPNKDIIELLLSYNLTKRKMSGITDDIEKERMQFKKLRDNLYRS